jgi:hypothetical protein
MVTGFKRERMIKPGLNNLTGGSGQGILVVDYYEIFKKIGWALTHIIQAPLYSERFNAGVVAPMQKKKIFGVVSRYVMILR